MIPCFCVSSVLSKSSGCNVRCNAFGVATADRVCYWWLKLLCNHLYPLVCLDGVSWSMPFFLFPTPFWECSSLSLTSVFSGVMPMYFTSFPVLVIPHVLGFDPSYVSFVPLVFKSECDNGLLRWFTSFIRTGNAYASCFFTVQFLYTQLYAVLLPFLRIHSDLGCCLPYGVEKELHTVRNGTTSRFGFWAI